MTVKTIQVSDNAHRTIIRWCKLKKMPAHTFFDMWINDVKNKKQQRFYDSLEDPKTIKPKILEKVKIKKFYKN